MSKIVAIIPARYESSRFPGKPLAIICGKPMIQWVYENVSSVEEINQVYVATDDVRIYDKVKSFGGEALMTSTNHVCGTDRIAECVEKLKLCDEDLIINVQGDEPLISVEMIRDILSCFTDKNVYMGTLKKKIMDENITNSNIVKVVCDKNDDAIYFSRYAIPYNRDGKENNYYKHIGIYGYRKKFLLEYSKMKKGFLEKCESLEQLRVLEEGYRIRVKETQYETIGVDTPEQVPQVEKKIQERMKNNE